MKKNNNLPLSKPGKMQIVINVVLLVLLSFLIVQNLFFREKTAYIDSSKILNGYNEIAAAKKIFKKKVELFNGRLDTLTGRVKLDLLNMEKFRNDKVRYASYRDSSVFHKKQVYDYQQAIRQSLKEEEANLTSAALKKLNVFLKDYGKRKGYDMIFIANNSGTIAYAKESYDISDDVLAEINK